MSLVIRLRKPGKSIKKRYHRKIVVDERNSKLNGSFVEQLGYYDPSQNPKLLKVDLEKYDKWVSQGAQPSDTVKSLAKKFRKIESTESQETS